MQTLPANPRLFKDDNFRAHLRCRPCRLRPRRPGPDYCYIKFFHKIYYTRQNAVYSYL